MEDFYIIIFTLSHIIIKSRFISDMPLTKGMIGEAITIAAIIGGSAATVWFAKNKFQPGIERELARIEASEYETAETFRRKHK